MNKDYILIAEANARLISAAPELLEACKTLLELDPPCPFIASDGRCKEWFDLWEKVDNAVQKAVS